MWNKPPGFKVDLNEIDEREDRTEERDSGAQKALEEGKGEEERTKHLAERG